MCGEKLQLREEYLCIPCLMDVPYTYFWDRSHNPMADLLNGRVQESVQPGIQERYAYAAALFFYNSESAYRQITQHLKYEGGVGMGKAFASALGRRLAGSPLFADVDAVIPVPLHWTRRWKRGYNQAEVIAKAVAACLDAPVRSDLLVRRRRTRTQIQLSVEDKRRNMSGAFSLGRKADGRGIHHILLVDDVFTTGATSVECFRTLRNLFPPKVRISVATLAFVSNV